jgi:UDP-N-acetylglucosamine 2-epimerase (non-hydrolysing)
MRSPLSPTILTLFGTRPEVIKLAPVLRALEQTTGVRSVVVSSGQHTDLLQPFVALFSLRIDHDLQLMRPGQTPNQVLARALAALDPVLEQEKPDAVLVQGDTTTALAGALAAFHRRIPVGHVEAGLRSGDPLNPFPEETNRRLITRLARWHFAATRQNRDILLSEGVPAEQIFLTGNPVVDALQEILRKESVTPHLQAIITETEGKKRIALTTHRRESFGEVMGDNLKVLREFVAAHEDVALIFPVHPNPQVRCVAGDILGNRSRIHLLPPFDYPDFIGLLARSWLIVSDSGGVQEEAPTLGVPLLVLRQNTERPEALECGAARLAPNAEVLRLMLEQTYLELCDNATSRPIANPFGEGDSGSRIVAALLQALSDGTMTGDCQ